MSREEHARTVIGTGTGPSDWRKQQNDQAVLADQTRRLASAIDDLGWHVRKRLADDLAGLIADVDASTSAVAHTPEEIDHQWSFDDALRSLGRLIEDPDAHHCDVIDSARDILDSSDHVVIEKPEYRCRLKEEDREKTVSAYVQKLEKDENDDKKFKNYAEIKEAAIDMFSDYDTQPYQHVRDRHLQWPDFDHVGVRQRLRSYLKDVTMLPWATPRPTEAPEIVGLVTGQTRRLEQYRELRMLPLIAQRERRSILNALRYWVDHHSRKDKDGKTYARFVVVTNGPRVGYHEDLQGAMRSFQRRISKWARISEEEHGVVVQFRATEFTLGIPLDEETEGEDKAEGNDKDKKKKKKPIFEIKNEIDETEGEGAHVHSNLIVEPKGWLGEENWKNYLQSMHAFFGTWTRDNGRIEDVREIIKYVCKPTDIAKNILNLSDESTKFERLQWLYGALNRTRIVAPLSNFKNVWRDEIESKKLKACVVGGIVRLVPKCESLERSDQKNPNVGENVICGQILANRCFTPWSEPSLLLLGRTSDPETPDGQRRLAIIEKMTSDAVAMWEANGAPRPDIAVAIAAAWTAAESDADARKIRAMGASAASAKKAAQTLALSTPAPSAGGFVPLPTPRPSAGGYIFNTGGLTVPGSVAESSVLKRGRLTVCDISKKTIHIGSLQNPHRWKSELLPDLDLPDYLLFEKDDLIDGETGEVVGHYALFGAIDPVPS